MAYPGSPNIYLRGKCVCTFPVCMAHDAPRPRNLPEFYSSWGFVATGAQRLGRGREEAWIYLWGRSSRQPPGPPQPGRGGAPTDTLQPGPQAEGVLVAARSSFPRGRSPRKGWTLQLSLPKLGVPWAQPSVRHRGYLLSVRIFETKPSRLAVSLL